MSEEDRALLQTVARDRPAGRRRNAGRTGRTPRAGRSLDPAPQAGPPPARSRRSADEPPQRDLAFFNGLGGFSRDGREYVTILPAGQTTPAPWVNVIANPQFGTVVSEGGSAYTWAENSHEFRLTPWHNDPVSDISGEAIYLRDEETGRFWSPSPLPARGHNTYVVRHGFGYSIFDYTEDGTDDRAVRLCGDRCAGQVLQAQDHQPLGASAAVVGDRLLGTGARRSRAASR